MVNPAQKLAPTLVSKNLKQNLSPIEKGVHSQLGQKPLKHTNINRTKRHKKKESYQASENVKQEYEYLLENQTNSNSNLLKYNIILQTNFCIRIYLLICIVGLTINNIIRESIFILKFFIFYFCVFVRHYGCSQLQFIVILLFPAPTPGLPPAPAILLPFPESPQLSRHLTFLFWMVLGRSCSGVKPKILNLLYCFIPNKSCCVILIV